MPPRSSLRLVVAATAAGAVAAALAGPAGAERPAPRGLHRLRVIPTCSRLAGARAVYRSRSGQVVVRRATVRGDGGPHDWACSSSNTSYASALGGSALGVPADESVDALGSAGPVLVAHESSSTGFRACAGSRPECAPVHNQIELVDVSSGASSSTSSGANVAVHLATVRTRRGARVSAVAWTEPAGRGLIRLSTMTMREPSSGTESNGGSAGPRAIGHIDPRSVRLRGLRLSWRQDGRLRHTTVR